MIPSTTLNRRSSAAIAERPSFIAPGQRYRTPDPSEQYLVSALKRDELGLLHVTLRSTSGRVFSAFAEQIETAIRTGDLLPVPAGGTLTRC